MTEEAARSPRSGPRIGRFWGATTSAAPSPELRPIQRTFQSDRGASPLRNRGMKAGRTQKWKPNGQAEEPARSPRRGLRIGRALERLPVSSPSPDASDPEKTSWDGQGASPHSNRSVRRMMRQSVPKGQIEAEDWEGVWGERVRWGTPWDAAETVPRGTGMRNHIKKPKCYARAPIGLPTLAMTKTRRDDYQCRTTPAICILAKTNRHLSWSPSIAFGCLACPSKSTNAGARLKSERYQHSSASIGRGRGAWGENAPVNTSPI